MNIQEYKNKIYHGDCLDFMKQVPDNYFDLILTDPPYKYLKNQKLETDFNEDEFFTGCKRILREGGFSFFW